MRILSWDVGIKNLAYCLIVKNEETYTIEKWESINLVDSHNYVCSGIMKNKKTCGKKATYCLHDSDKNMGYYCKTHKDDNVVDIQTYEEKFKLLIQESKQHKQTCTYEAPKTKNICGKNGKYSYDEQIFCEQHKKQFITTTKKELQPVLLKKIKSTSNDIQFLSEEMYKKLDAIEDLLMVDDVLIENQPVFKNPTMKTMGSLLFGYFIMRGVVEKDKTKSTIKKVKFISAANKLKINEEENKELEKIINNKKVNNKKVNKVNNVNNNKVNNNKVNNNKVNNKVNNNKPTTRSTLEIEAINKFNSEFTVNSIYDFKNLFGESYMYYAKYIAKQYNTLNNDHQQYMDHVFDILQIKPKINKKIKSTKEDKQEYVLRKDLGIEYTKLLLKKNKNDVMLNHLNTYKKLDDLCDAFLQGYHYLFIRKHV